MAAVVMNNLQAIFNSKGRFALYPGANPVTDKDLAILQSDSSFVSMCKNIDKGTHRVILEVIRDTGKRGDQQVELEKIADVTTGDTDVDAAHKFAALSEATAIVTVDGIYSVRTLKQIILLDGRPHVIEAARKQLDSLTKNDTEE